MALKANSDVKPGDKVTVSAFKAVVTAGPSTSSCTRLTDDNGKVSYVYKTQLNRTLPYADGTVYADASGARFTWIATTQRWRDTGGTFRSFAYPTRPLREVTLGPALTD